MIIVIKYDFTKISIDNTINVPKLTKLSPTQYESALYILSKISVSILNNNLNISKYIIT